MEGLHIMYAENICINHITTENSNYSQHHPVNHKPEDSSTFSEILTDTIQETTPSYPAYPTSSVSYTDEIEEINIYNTYPVDDDETEEVNLNNSYPVDDEAGKVNTNNNVYPMNSVPPVIKPSPSSESSYISQYYPISESEVILKIAEVRHAINSENLSLKTSIERYNFIENRFVEAFGKDFMIARNLNLPSSTFYMIGIEYNNTLNRHIENPEQVNRQRLYGNASTESVQNTIRNSFPANLTNRDLFLMVNQMRNAGVLDSASIRSLGANDAKRVMDTLALLNKYARFLTMPKDERSRALTIDERDRRWVDKLNDAVSTHDLLCTYNVWALYDRVNIDPDSTKFLINHMGGELGENGLFIVDAFDDIDWNRLMDMMFTEYGEYDALIQSRMNEINLAYSALNGSNVPVEDNSEIEDSGAAEDNNVGNIIIGESENQSDDDFSDGDSEAA